MIDKQLVNDAMDRAVGVLKTVTKDLGVRGLALGARRLSEKDQLQKFLNMKDEDHQALVRKYGQTEVGRYMARMRDISGRV